jgi:hypothetical protein
MVVKPVPTTLTSLFDIETLPQLSVAVAFGAGMEPTLTVTSAGANVNVGAVLSATVITWVAVDVLPQSSSAVNVRVRTYVPGQDPGAFDADTVTVAEPEQSDAVAISSTNTSPHWAV